MYDCEFLKQLIAYLRFKLVKPSQFYLTELCVLVPQKHKCVSYVLIPCTLPSLGSITEEERNLIPCENKEEEHWYRHCQLEVVPVSDSKSQASQY